MDASLMRERVTAALSSLFAGLAVLLTAIGLYSLLAYSVIQRAREIGIRTAVGATRPDVMRLIALEALGLTLLGLAIGIPGAFWVGHLTRSLLFGVTSWDPSVMASAAAFLLLVVVGAAVLPAWRASRIDPFAALRSE